MNKRICNVLKCNRSIEAKGMCNKHYQRAKAGRPLDDKPTYSECTVEGCGKKPRSTHATLCAMHYHRMYRNGTLDRLATQPRWQDIEGRRYGTLTAVSRDGDFWVCRCDCGGTRRASAGELNRTGDANTCGIPGRHLSQTPSYEAAHGRVKRLRGHARSHQCVGCGRQADHWSYNHDDADELHAVGLSKHAIAYSATPEHYSPRCVPCHKRFDLKRIDAAPHHLHDRIRQGT